MKLLKENKILDKKMTDPLWRMVRARSDHFLQKGNEIYQSSVYKLKSGTQSLVLFIKKYKN
jgi:hypothetical protein